MVIPEGGIIDRGMLNHDFEFAKNENNDLDYIGRNHNEIIVDFEAKKIPVTAKNYYTYLNNHSKYSAGLQYFDLVDIVNLFKNNREHLDMDQTVQNIIKELPIELRDSFAEKLNELLQSSNNRTFVSKVINMENGYINNRSFDEELNTKLKIFFSTLRYSAALWNL